MGGADGAGVTLVCPSCRRMGPDGVIAAPLAPTEGGLGCACSAFYPVVDGIPIILRDLLGWMGAEGAEVLRRTDLAPALARRLGHAVGGAVARNQDLVDAYRAVPPGPWTSWLEATVAALPRPVITLGAGLGLPDTLGVDLSFALLRAGRGGIVADATDPPFLADSAAAVVLPNLLDSCADPGVVLHQAAALVRPGGTLVVGCAYAFNAAITPRACWFGPEHLRAALEGGPWFGHPLPLRLESEVEALEWRVPVGPRSVNVHLVHAMVARRVG